MPSAHPADDITLLLHVLPDRIRALLASISDGAQLLEIVLDLGRLPEIRYPDRMEMLDSEPVSRADLKHVVERVGRFSDDNRAGIERTLHRISAIRNRLGEIVGITCRVGRAVIGTVDILRDVIEASRSLLLLGRPGVGKTTLLREAARVLADEFGKRVVIVDTSNEIGGDGDIPHPGIGRARRMQVPSVARQHAVMIEAVENHMPEVIVIDEIGTEAEAAAARTIAERGVQLIATAHGNTLDNILQNPTLADLVGGIQAVTLSDEEARRRRTKKTVLERKAPPTFEVLVELQSGGRLAVHHQVAEVVDRVLAGGEASAELRQRDENGGIVVTPAEKKETAPEPSRRRQGGVSAGRTVRIFPYGVSRSRLERAAEKFGLRIEIVNDPRRADLILTLKSQEKRQPRRLRELQAHGVRCHVLRSNTGIQIENFLRATFHLEGGQDGEQQALGEAAAVAEKVLRQGRPEELAPQPPSVRALQHQIGQRAGLVTESKGRGPYRRVVFYP